MNIRYFIRDNSAGMTESLAYRILRYPYVTEKTTNMAQQKYITIVVESRYNKCDIKKACSLVFNNLVEKVNIINQKQRLRSFRGKVYRKSSFKKAMIFFKSSEVIENIIGGKR